MKSECPVCGSSVDLGNEPFVNELVICQECGSELEIISLAPVVLAEAPQQEEDWGE